jgi:hypothetical protein
MDTSNDWQDIGAPQSVSASPSAIQPGAKSIATPPDSQNAKDDNTDVSAAVLPGGHNACPVSGNDWVDIEKDSTPSEENQSKASSPGWVDRALLKGVGNAMDLAPNLVNGGVDLTNWSAGTHLSHPYADPFACLTPSSLMQLHSPPMILTDDADLLLSTSFCSLRTPSHHGFFWWGSRPRARDVQGRSLPREQARLCSSAPRGGACGSL